MDRLNDTPHASTPAPADAGGTGTLPLGITHAEMNAAYDQGTAVPLADTISWLVRYQDHWWVVYERGWLRITDTLTAADLDDTAARITPSQARVARDTQIRATLALTPDPAASQETEHPCPPPKP